MAWSQFECEAIVRDYFAMLSLEVAGQSYRKSEHRRNLIKLLDNRSDGSIEYKHQNISAILIELGYPYLQGYKPALNYQGLLKNVVVSHLVESSTQAEDNIEALANNYPDPDRVYDWAYVLQDAPEFDQRAVREQSRTYSPTKYNFAEREKKNRKLGELGESFVLAYEKHRLISAGRLDLSREVEWTSKMLGDGAGYDIRSFDEISDQERFIEVKTTNSGKYQPFMITDNEVEFSADNERDYVLYRVFDFKRRPRLFTLEGDIEKHVILQPKLYRAGF